jgi:hypothetical protein
MSALSMDFFARLADTAIAFPNWVSVWEGDSASFCNSEHSTIMMTARHKDMTAVNSASDSSNTSKNKIPRLSGNLPQQAAIVNCHCHPIKVDMMGDIMVKIAHGIGDLPGWAA